MFRKLAVPIFSLTLSLGLIAQLPPTPSTTGANTNSTQAGNAAPAANPGPAAAQAPSAGPSTNASDAVIVPPDGIKGNDESSIEGDPLLKPPPLPKGKVTMVGGSVTKIDPIRDSLIVEPFGSHEKMKISFDDRTHVYRDGRETTYGNIHRGDRVYVDTMNDGPRVFARNIRVANQITPASASGQVQAYNPQTGVMTVQDQISSSPVTFAVTSQTAVTRRDGKAGTANDLKADSLVAVEFFPGQGKHGAAKQVQVIALPGESFTFAGKITNVDLRNGMIAVNNQTDDRIYDIALNGQTADRDQLRIGKDVAVVATFTGKGYRAESIQPQK